MSDRRDPQRQRPDPLGDRVEDPSNNFGMLRPIDCARRLGVGSAFVIGEIRDGRLRCAVVLERPGKRTVYRIRPADLEAYMTRYNWKGLAARLGC